MRPRRYYVQWVYSISIYMHAIIISYYTWKEYEKLDQCSEYGDSRYKVNDNNGDDYGNVSKKRPPVKFVWYFLIILRFKRHFANANDAKNIRWNAYERNRDGNIHRVADSLQWKKIDSLFLVFRLGPRNLRLGFSTNGMNPFGNLSTNHTSWPILLTIYNISHWLCMKRKYILLFMMISGPKQSENDIYVYLSPLIEDLRLLREKGIDIDACNVIFLKKSTTFFHMVIWLDTVSRNIKCVMYVNRIHVFTNFSLEKRLFTLEIRNF